MWQDNAQSHHPYVKIAGRHDPDKLSRATVGVQGCGTSMSAVHQAVLTLVGTAHGRLTTKGRARPSRAGLDGRRERRLSLLSLRAKRKWPSSMMGGGGS